VTSSVIRWLADLVSVIGPPRRRVSTNYKLK